MAKLYVPWVSSVDGITLSEKEIVYNTSDKCIYVGDGQTEGGVAVVMGREYTINGQAPVSNNFTITPETIGAAPADHPHEISGVTGLQDALNGKSNAGHGHTMVSGLIVAGATLTGAVQLLAGSNVQFVKTGNQITIAVDPSIAGASVAVSNLAVVGGNQVKSFIGTQAEWDALTKESGVTYLVYIVGA